MGLKMTGQEPGRNDPCPCGSKLKYKWCHGDESKRLIANRVANLKMMELVLQEQKKRGIVPWKWECTSCKHGFDLPKESTVTVGGCAVPICPKCETANIKQNSNEEKNEEDKSQESNIREFDARNEI